MKLSWAMLTSCATSLAIAVAGRAQADTVFVRYDSIRWDEQQTYVVDTLVFENPNDRMILHGTTLLPNSSGQRSVLNFGLEAVAVRLDPCRNEGKPGAAEVIGITDLEDSVIITVQVPGNCCHSFLCDAEVQDNGAINLLYHGYGAMYCECTCCFVLTYTFAKWNTDAFSQVTGVMIGGDKTTRKPIR